MDCWDQIEAVSWTRRWTQADDESPSRGQMRDLPLSANLNLGSHGEHNDGREEGGLGMRLRRVTL